MEVSLSITKITLQLKLGMAAHACNPSYMGSGCRQTAQASLGNSPRPYLTVTCEEELGAYLKCR